MNILLVAATKAEIEPFLRSHEILELPTAKKRIGKHHLNILLSGVGMVSTAFTLGSYFKQNKFDLAINVGIAGSFDSTLLPGDLCRVQEDILSEFGAEDGESFLRADQIALGKNIFLASTFTDFPSYNKLPKVKAITVNKVHGDEKSIAQIIDRYQPQIETMEGAAFFFACNQSGINGIQIRSISNKIERRNKENWQIGLAIKNLNDLLIQILTYEA